MVNFFFYALGSSEQKTQLGLERALVYQVLNAEPSLIPELLPHMWREALDSNKYLGVPSPAELKTVITHIGQGLNCARKFCFFIDGLDEYEGDCSRGISTIRHLAVNPNVKVIVASRPIPDCVQSFRGFRTLQLQDLTKRDITNYANDVIGSHAYIKQLAQNQSPTVLADICHNIASKASGVFLWVVLACGSLLKGFASHDTIESLNARIDELPEELEDLFRHMLRKIGPRYQAQAAKLLRVCYENKLNGEPDLPTIGLAIVEDARFELVHGSPLETSPVAKRPKCEGLEARLRSHCRGLLEIQKLQLSNIWLCFCHAEKTCDVTALSVRLRNVFIYRQQRPALW